jgi:hypothetical protein
MKMEKRQLLPLIQNKHLRRKRIQDLLFGDPIYQRAYYCDNANVKE